MPRILKLLSPLPLMLLCAAAPALAQPTITNITPAYGGGGPNSPGSFTITGTGFTNPYVQKSVRLVDGNNADVIAGVDCTGGAGTTCTASFVKPYRVAPGTVTTIQVYVMVNGIRSGSSFPFTYYGEPIVTNPPPGGPYDVNTPYVLTGGPWTTNAGASPGLTSVYLYSSIFDGGCESTSACTRTATRVTTDCCVGQGAYTIDIRTPGGFTHSYFRYGTTPAIPAISSVSPTGGAEGDVVTVTGTNFIPGRTTFTFNTKGSFGTSNQAVGVSCTTTKCAVTVPNGGSGGPADIQVLTSCAANSAPCTTNPRVSSSIPFTRINGFAYAGIKVTTDNNTYNLYTNENGHTAQYRVSLYTQPTANVTVAVSLSSGTGVLLSPSTLTFTPQNWAAPQTVTITGAANASAGNAGYTIRNIASSADTKYNGIERDTAITNHDNGAKNFTVTPTGGLVTTRSGGTATYKIVLSAAPTANVVVKLASSDPVAGTVSPSTFTFTTAAGGTFGWNVPQTITVTGQNDGWPGRNRDYSIIMTTTSSDTTYGNPNSLYPPDVFVTNVDAATTPSGLSLTRTGPGAATATWNLVGSADYYNIKYSTTLGGAKTTLASTGNPGQTLTGLTVGQQYYFVISSVNAGGESTNSAELPFIMYPPGPYGAFDTDSKAEMTVYQANGDWKILNSIGGYVSSTTVSLGGTGYVPVPGDYDGDRRQDVAVYNPSTGAWNILLSSTNFTTSLNLGWGGGGSTFVPVPGDYDGDGKTDPAVYRPSTARWSILTSSSNYLSSLTVDWGGAGYTPIFGQDFDGDFRADVAVYQESTGTWLVLKSTTNYATAIIEAWGGVGYTLVPGDYDGDHKADLGLYQRATGTWAVLLSGANYTTALNKPWGGLGYLPAPADYDADGKIDLGVFQQSTGNWYALLSGSGYVTTVSASGWGTNADRIISSAIFVGGDDARHGADFDGDSRAEITVYNTTTGAWSSLTSASSYTTAVNRTLGGTGFTAVTGDYDGDGLADIGRYQASTGSWSIALSSTNFTSSLNKSVGGTAWIPMPGDYDGDGRTDFVVHNPTTGQWYGLKSSTNYTTTVNVMYGGPVYTPITGDFDGDGKTDLGVYRQSTGDWSVLLAASNYTTSLTSLVGGPAWVPVAGDYDGDGRTDFVVYNASTGQWYGLKSIANYTTTVNVFWGGPTYTPVKGDYDGDGRADLAAYVQTTGNVYVLLSSSNYTTTIVRPLGGPGYIAVPRYP
jgi:FG-GAP-like repeat/Fibronectin type III domain